MFLRIGELADLHEGQVAHRIAERLVAGLGRSNVTVPPEGAFGTGLNPLVPVAESMIRRNRDRKFVVIIDEFDDLHVSFYAGERGRLFVKALRSMSEAGIAFFFVGSERMDTIYSLHATDLNKWVNVHLDVIESREDCRALVLRPVEEAIEYEQTALDRILEFCGGNPYYMHLICAQVFQHCASEERTYVSGDDLDGVISSRCRSLGDTSFAHFWADNPVLDDAAKEQPAAENCLFLACLAAALGPGTTASDLTEVQDRLPLGPGQRLSQSELASIAERLRRRRVVRTTPEGTLDVALPIFRRWLADNAEVRLLPQWRDYCVRRDATPEPLERVAVQAAFDVGFPIPEEELHAVAISLEYMGKAKEVAEIRGWLKQFDDDNRIQIAFKLLKRLAKLGYVSQSNKTRLTVKLADMVTDEQVEQGGWILGSTGKKDNLCVSYLDSDTEIKSGAAFAVEIGNLLRPSKKGRPGELSAWMVNHLEHRSMLLFADLFAGTGEQAVEGLKRFINDPNTRTLATHYLRGHRIAVGLLTAFPRARDRIRSAYPDVRVLVAHTFGDDVMALDEQAAIYENADERQIALLMLNQVGRELLPKQPFGWGDMGALVCFPTTVPNNTLPMFWCNGKVNNRPWRPLFPRP